MGIGHLSPEEYRLLKEEILEELRSAWPQHNELDVEPDDVEPTPTSKTNSLEWVKQRSAEAKKRIAAEAQKPPPAVLVPVRHAQRDFFVADILDVSAKDDLASMEHPLFALKAGDKRVRTYQRGDVSVVVKPGFDGCATIHDKDVWIYCVSQLIEAMNRGREVSRTVRFTGHDFLVTTNRPTAGVGYDRMLEALGRLKGTVIETNIATSDIKERRGFGLVDSWRVIEEKSGRMVAIEVTLPDWLYRSVQIGHVLTLSPDYFRIRKPLDRRIYELARKHCGQQRQWRCNLETLHEKSGSTASLREFRRTVKTLVQANDLPDYRVQLNEFDRVTFTRR